MATDGFRMEAIFIKMWIPTCNVQYKHVTLYQHLLISKGDNGKLSFFSQFNARVISLLTVYYNGADFITINTLPS
jgi:hypothetical protein